MPEWDSARCPSEYPRSVSLPRDTIMSQYIDGFIIPVAIDRLEEYRALAEEAAQIWKEHGALDYRECLADDLESREMASFSTLLAAKPGETVIFAWVMFASREHRDATNAKIVSDPRLRELCARGERIFDSKRMAYGGFRTLIHPA